ncbi:hypothetical protein ACQKLX_21285 [Bosea sp. NPDC003192]|uniref:hypothetical protein n=1 Tax=Bosea sp. NPDC003192 TaxID=3390551 RepID=UPI003D07B716
MLLLGFWAGEATPAYSQTTASIELLSQNAEFPSAAVMPLFDKLAPFMAKAEAASAVPELNCGRTSEGYFSCFNPKSVLEPNSGKASAALQTRKLALRTVELYLGLVADLSEGRDKVAVEKRSVELRGILNAIGKLASLGGPAPGFIGQQASKAIGEFVLILDKSTSEAALRKALVNGQPLVTQILDLLVIDTTNMYDIYKSGRNIEIISIQNEMISAERQGISSKRGQNDIDSIVADVNDYYQSLYLYVIFLNQSRTAVGEIGGAIAPTDAEARKRLLTAARQQSAAQWLWRFLADTAIRSRQ